jgi:hypothetical protein
MTDRRGGRNVIPAEGQNIAVISNIAEPGHQRDAAPVPNLVIIMY